MSRYLSETLWDQNQTAQLWRTSFEIEARSTLLSRNGLEALETEMASKDPITFSMNSLLPHQLPRPCGQWLDGWEWKNRMAQRSHQRQDEFPVCQERQQSFADCACRIVVLCRRSIPNKFDLLSRLIKFDALKKYEHKFSNSIYIIINSWANSLHWSEFYKFSVLLSSVDRIYRLCDKLKINIVERTVHVFVRSVKIMFSWIEKWFCECCLICNCARTIL